VEAGIGGERLDLSEDRAARSQGAESASSRWRRGWDHALVIPALATFLALVGCSTERKAPMPTTRSVTASPASGMAKTDALHQSASACSRPLDDYCRRSACPNLALSIAKLQTCAREGCVIAVVRQCGDLRYTEAGDGFVSVKEYFDSEDRLVAAHTTTDALSMNPACRNWTHYGPHPNCSKPTIITDYLSNPHARPNE